VQVLDGVKKKEKYMDPATFQMLVAVSGCDHLWS
jgi:hypothetical protein